MKKESEKVIELLKSNFESNKTVKTVIYLVSAAALVYVTGRMFSMLAGSIRGYNDFKAALQGN